MDRGGEPGYSGGGGSPPQKHRIRSHRGYHNCMRKKKKRDQGVQTIEGKVNYILKVGQRTAKEDGVKEGDKKTTGRRRGGTGFPRITRQTGIR